MLSSRVLQPGLKAMGLWTQFQSIRIAHRKLGQLFSMPKEEGGKFIPAEGLQGAVELRNLHFKYPTQENPLIDGISLPIKPGEAIAITGNNGAGKSTLINLIAGFVQPDQGGGAIRWPRHQGI